MMEVKKKNSWRKTHDTNVLVQSSKLIINIRNNPLVSQGNPTLSIARSVTTTLRAEHYIDQRTAAPSRWQKSPPS